MRKKYEIDLSISSLTCKEKFVKQIVEFSWTSKKIYYTQGFILYDYIIYSIYVYECTSSLSQLVKPSHIALLWMRRCTYSMMLHIWDYVRRDLLEGMCLNYSDFYNSFYCVLFKPLKQMNMENCAIILLDFIVRIFCTVIETHL